MSLEGIQLGQYHLKSIIGSGGMGEVYLAEDARINQQVAIKVSRTEASPYPDSNSASESARLFQREARAIAQLDHPHILPLYGYGEEQIRGETLTYIVMPYRPEGSLVNWLRQRTQSVLLDPQDVAAIVTQAATALQYAHDHNVIHQDVKPANFLVRNRNDGNTSVPDLLLTDFGIARLSSATSHSSHAVRGTAAYMAPEQWAGVPVPATDQYALAVMAYELLTGRTPFQGRQEQMMFAHISTPPQPPSTFNPRISSDVDRVLLHALAKKPEERFRSIAAFANAFQQAAQSDDAPTVIKPLSNNPESGQVAASTPATILMPNNNNTARSDVTVAVPDPITPYPNYAAIQTPTKPQKTSNRKLLLFIGLALIVILASVGIYYVQTTGKQNNNNSTSQTLNTTGTHVALTATMQTNSRNATATQTRNYANATATAVNTSPYHIPGTTLALNDPLSTNSGGNNWVEGTTDTGSCGFTGGTYQAYSPIKTYYHACAALNTNFTNFVYEIGLTIIAGNCGAIIFRGDISAKDYYFFRICQDGSYDLYIYAGSGGSAKTLVQCDTPCSSPYIHSGLNQPNLLAVVANNTSISLYVNHQLITSSIDGTYSHGQIGIVADNDTSPTKVMFSNAKVWTL